MHEHTVTNLTIGLTYTISLDVKSSDISCEESNKRCRLETITKQCTTKCDSIQGPYEAHKVKQGNIIDSNPFREVK